MGVLPTKEKYLDIAEEEEIKLEEIELAEFQDKDEGAIYETHRRRTTEIKAIKNNLEKEEVKARKGVSLSL